MLIAWFPVLLLLAGLVLFATTSREPWHELGRAAMWCGLLVLALVLAHHTVRFGS